MIVKIVQFSFFFFFVSFPYSRPRKNARLSRKLCAKKNPKPSNPIAVLFACLFFFQFFQFFRFSAPDT